MVNKSLAIAMYIQGFSLSKIGEEFGVSRQRVWQIIKKHYSSITSDIKGREKPRPGEDWCIPIASEKYVYSKLKRRGYKPEYLSYCNTADIVANGNKIQVKYRSNPVHRGKDSYYYSFNYLTEKVKPDIYVFVCGNLNNPISYIVPGKDINTDSLNIPETPKSKTTKKFKRNYLEKWSIIKEKQHLLDIRCML